MTPASGCPREVVEARLLDEISKLKSLTAGASPAGADRTQPAQAAQRHRRRRRVSLRHSGPKAASDSGKPSPEATPLHRRNDRPRQAAQLSQRRGAGGAVARRNRSGPQPHPRLPRMGRGPLSAQESNSKDRNSIRFARQRCRRISARREIENRGTNPAGVLHRRNRIRQERGPGLQNHGQWRTAVYQDQGRQTRSRIQDTAVSAEALLPDGPYDLWREGEKSRRLKDLVGAFALSPQLPKMLNRGAILETLVLGCKEGQFVLRVIRPDRSVRTFWRQEPDEAGDQGPQPRGRAPRGRRTG